MPIGTTNSAAEPCALALRRAILGGELSPGVRLPPERALAERFGINRVTVRSALAQLEAEHLLSVRQGSGYTVRDYRREGGPDLIGALVDIARGAAHKKAIVADLLLVRRQLARALFERLLEAPDVEAIRRAELALDRFAVAAKRRAPAKELATADLEIVTELALATRSTVLALCLNPIATVLRTLPGLTHAMYRDAEANADAWRAVFMWLRHSKRDARDIETIIAQLALRDASTLQTLFGKKR